MKRTALLSALALVLCARAAHSLMVAPSPLPERMAAAECVVVGKVTEIEKKSVKALPAPGGNQLVEYHVAVVKVEDGLLGAKGLTHVRIGFIPTPAPEPVNPEKPFIRRPFRGTPNLTVGMEACFLLDPHHDQTFHVISGFQGMIIKPKDDTEFKKQVAELRHCAKLLEDPMAGLKSKNASDRFTTAAMLLSRYKTPVPNSKTNKQEPISAEESKLILLAIRDADWTQQRNFNQTNPMSAFGRLGISQKDGFQPPKDFKQYPTQAKAWLTKNAGTYRITRFVADKK